MAITLAEVWQDMANLVNRAVAAETERDALKEELATLKAARVPLPHDNEQASIPDQRPPDPASPADVQPGGSGNPNPNPDADTEATSGGTG